jgi:hypothetical protein
MTAPTQVPVTRDDLGYEPKHRRKPDHEWAFSDPMTQAGHTNENPCPRCRPELYVARHRAEVA